MKENITINDLIKILQGLTPEERNMPIAVIAYYHDTEEGSGYDFQIGNAADPLHNFIPLYK